MSDDDSGQDGIMWPPNLLKTVQETSEQATKKQQEALQQLLLGGGTATPDLGDLSDQIGTMSQMATFKTRVQSGGRVSIPDAEREALDIEEGDIVQAVVVPVKRKRDDD
ncbi:homolog to PHA granule-associated 12K protein [Natronomonas pharaonis DSM 2160]|uniref:Homolog to PHA granule-associated 12K protein n=1 Tax=Natronomonas pharaonis (strain ATCC 35678 / DSM 2160 / CIP 103997 / JCM 8858 / NBRC 14720 / NCIMB 2260 / Gabara) TaxID=348780 RepID=A0A1U7ETS7_NATPD|nr:AbrB/MazE/SpoVT family DNA-binding domain-containing protein [Natronomonas pharaonis]CAI48334.2 homolog to PHA granule-associated 12K protein [Natronomonas pharaonis DSM 2160]